MTLKSAWEIALERSGGQPLAKLTDEQKKRLAELEKLYTAKIAQEEFTLKPKIAEARAAGDEEKARKLEDQLQSAIAKLRGKLEEEKEKVRKGL